MFFCIIAHARKIIKSKNTKKQNLFVEFNTKKQISKQENCTKKQNSKRRETAINSKRRETAIFNKKIRDTPVVIVPKGYELEDLLEMDDSVMDGDEPLYLDEVEVIYE